MTAFTTNQWAILALVLLLGWLLGLASRSGGRKWRRDYERERAEHLAYRKEQEARVAAAEQRTAELERQLAARPVTPVAPVATANAASVASASSSVTHDDLTAIRGIDAPRAAALNAAGLHSFRDVEHIFGDDAARLEERLNLAPGTIEREQWREQAALLRNGDRGTWARTFGAGA